MTEKKYPFHIRKSRGNLSRDRCWRSHTWHKREASRLGLCDATDPMAPFPTHNRCIRVNFKILCATGRGKIPDGLGICVSLHIGFWLSDGFTGLCGHAQRLDRKFPFHEGREQNSHAGRKSGLGLSFMPAPPERYSTRLIGVWRSLLVASTLIQPSSIVV